MSNRDDTGPLGLIPDASSSMLITRFELQSDSLQIDKSAVSKIKRIDIDQPGNDSATAMASRMTPI